MPHTSRFPALAKTSKMHIDNKSQGSNLGGAYERWEPGELLWERKLWERKR